MSNDIANLANLPEYEKDIIRASIGMKYGLSKHIGWREKAMRLSDTLASKINHAKPGDVIVINPGLKENNG